MLWIIGTAIMIWLYCVLVYWITALVVYLGGYDNSNGDVFFTVFVIITGVLWFIGFCVKCKDD